MALATWILWVGLVGYAEGGATPDAVRRDYEAARLAAGRDVDSQLKLALWCERHGLNAERRRHLALAVMADPKNPTARGLLGQVADGEKWSTVAQPGQPPDPGPDTAMREEYRRRRDAMKGSADSHLKLARWCDEAGLKEESVAHYRATVRLDPLRDEAWKRLGYKSRKGRWVTDGQLALERAQATAQQKANKHWRPKLASIRSRLEGRDQAAREAAEVEVAGVTDPLAVPSIWDVFANSGTSGQRTAAQLFGQIDAPSASHSLALLALYAEKPETRRVALETLRHRETRDYLSIFVDLVAEPVTYRVQAVSGPGTQGVLAIDGNGTSVRRIYAPPAMPDIPLFDGEQISYDQEGLPVVTRMTGFNRETTTTTTSVDPNAYFAGDVKGVARNEATLAQARQSYNNLVANPAGGLYAKRTGWGNGIRGLYTPTSAETAADARINVTTTTDVDRPTGFTIPIGQIAREYQRSAFVAQQQLAGDVQAIEASNEQIRFSNDRVLGALKTLTGQDLGADREAWARWWAREQGYAFALAPGSQSTATIEQVVPLGYTPQPIGGAPTQGAVINTQVTNGATAGTTGAFDRSMQEQGFMRASHNCFAQGTPVRTADGPRPIETLRIGDRVLVQDQDDGQLRVQPIVQVYHNQPSPTLRIALGDESVVATPIHRFWVAGRGWVQTERLAVGDRIRTLAGLAAVKSIEEAGVQPVFNLEVASGESYFVGSSGLLVHDNSTIRPTPKPFDAIAEAGPVVAR
ncbi:polymorphic toxin-type HINT domain-containing protein [Isosphaeraceae bacterium EP7]